MIECEKHLFDYFSAGNYYKQGIYPINMERIEIEPMKLGTCRHCECDLDVWGVVMVHKHLKVEKIVCVKCNLSLWRS